VKTFWNCLMVVCVLFLLVIIVYVIDRDNKGVKTQFCINLEQNTFTGKVIGTVYLGTDSTALTNGEDLVDNVLIGGLIGYGLGSISKRSATGALYGAAVGALVTDKDSLLVSARALIVILASRNNTFYLAVVEGDDDLSDNNLLPSRSDSPTKAQLYAAIRPGIIIRIPNDTTLGKFAKVSTKHIFLPGETISGVESRNH